MEVQGVVPVGRPGAAPSPIFPSSHLPVGWLGWPGLLFPISYSPMLPSPGGAVRAAGSPFPISYSPMLPSPGGAVRVAGSPCGGEPGCFGATVGSAGCVD